MGTDSLRAGSLAPGCCGLALASPSRHRLSSLRGLHGPEHPDSGLKGCTRRVNSPRFQTSEHQLSHSDVDHRLTRLRLPLVVLAQPPIPAQPGERPLHDPPPLHHLERLALLLLRLRSDPQHPAAELLRPLGDPAIADPI